MTDTPEPDPQPDVPANSAKALERIFWKVRASNVRSISQVWTTILGVQVDSREFIALHAEVVNLVDDVDRYLMALPAGDELRERHASDSPKWYRVVVPRENWTADVAAFDSLIEATDIRLLGALGDVIKYQSPGATLQNTDVAELTSALDDWRTQLDSVEDIPDDLKRQILEQVDHIFRLLNRADLYGYKPVINESGTLLNYGFIALKYAPNAVALADLVARISLVVTHWQVGDPGQAANMAVAACSSLTDALERVRERKALPPGKQRELTQGKQNELPPAKEDE